MNPALAVAAAVALGGSIIALGIPDPPSCSPTPRMSMEESMTIKREFLHGRPARDYELDHIIPLCMGGSNARSNLQLQPWPEARLKDEVEISLCRQLRARQITCEAARERMINWRTP